MLSPFVPANAGTQESEAVSFWVYILASRRNGTLYVGMTDDLARRSWEHRTGARTKRKSRSLGPRFRGDERRHGTDHSTFRLSLRTNVPHFFSSLSMSLAYSSGVEVRGSPPSATMRCLTSALSASARSATLRRAMIGGGVPAGASSP